MSSAINKSTVARTNERLLIVSHSDPDSMCMRESYIEEDSIPGEFLCRSPAMGTW